MANVDIVRVGIVESVNDEMEAKRIDFHFENGQESLKAFPALPKTIQSLPKVGEQTLILQGPNSEYYYLGPLIPQPQQMYDATSATSQVCNKKESSLLATPKNYTDYSGCYADNSDVALIGRKSEDIVLKDDEIDIRCGIRNKPINPDNDDYKGYISFNGVNSAYIQLKYGNGKLAQDNNQEANSMINLVADKINIISNKDTNVGKLAESGKLVGKAGKTYDEVMANLHQLPLGDELVDFLKKIRDAIDNHVHPYPGLPPCKDENVIAVDEQDLDLILSKHVRIS